MIHRFLAEETALSKLIWALLAGAAAVGAVMYFPQLSFIVSDLRHVGSWLGNGGFW